MTLLILLALIVAVIIASALDGVMTTRTRTR
jgi:archaellum component FlaG (FlaF/FlaG flagellin family)